MDVLNLLNSKDGMYNVSLAHCVGVEPAIVISYLYNKCISYDSQYVVIITELMHSCLGIDENKIKHILKVLENCKILTNVSGKKHNEYKVDIELLKHFITTMEKNSYATYFDSMKMFNDRFSDAYTIYSWMIRDLDLKGIELLVFAYIYSTHSINNTKKMLCKAMGLESSLRGVSEALNSLVKKKYICKVDVFDKLNPKQLLYCRYYINLNNEKIKYIIDCYNKGRVINGNK